MCECDKIRRGTSFMFRILGLSCSSSVFTVLYEMPHIEYLLITGLNYGSGKSAATHLSLNHYTCLWAPEEQEL